MEMMEAQKRMRTDKGAWQLAVMGGRRKAGGEFQARFRMDSHRRKRWKAQLSTRGRWGSQFSEQKEQPGRYENDKIKGFLQLYAKLQWPALIFITQRRLQAKRVRCISCGTTSYCCAMQWEGVPMFISSNQAYRPGTSSGLRWKDIEPILGLLYSVVGAHHDPAIVREGQERAGKEPPIISL
jgi:hypothetical protein